MGGNRRTYTIDDYNNGDDYKVYLRALQVAPDVAQQMAQDAWDNPWQTAWHATKTIGTAGAIGFAIGYAVPSRGPASMILGTILTAPQIYNVGKTLVDAQNAALQPGADQDLIARALAQHAIGGTVDLTLGFAGGFGGAELGYRAAGMKGTVGKIGQTTQKAIMQGENHTMSFFREATTPRTKGLAGIAAEIEGSQAAAAASKATTPAPRRIDISAKEPKIGGMVTDLTGTEIASAPRIVKPRRSTEPEQQPFYSRQFSILNRRVEQFKGDTPDGYQLYRGPLHGHSNRSDGTGTPPEIYQKAKDEGLDFAAITDHNHTAVRAKDDESLPNVAEEPALFAKTFEEAAAATTSEFVGLVGIEMGTIGKVGKGGHKHEDFAGPDPVPGGATTDLLARTTQVALENPGKVTIDTGAGRVTADRLPAKPGEPGSLTEKLGRGANEAPPPTVGKNPDGPVEGPVAKTPHKGAHEETDARIPETLEESVAPEHLGGTNHINLFEVPTFFEAVRVPRNSLLDTGRQLVGMEPRYRLVEPDVVKYNDGDYKALVGHLDLLTDATGGKPVVQLNHPRFRADENPDLPRGSRAHDYGQKSFRSQKEWRERFVDPYVRQIEMIKGGALNPDPVDVVKPGSVDAGSFAGYLDKGVHASPTFGRDFHFGDPAGTPGTTMIMAKSLDKPALMDALRNRRTIATTNGDLLNGTMWGNGKHPMGSILDQAVAPELSLTVNIGGKVVPEAEYTVKIWGDKKIGDKKPAEWIYEQKLTGEEVIASGGKVEFDPIEHTLGRKSTYYAEISRKDPVTEHTDRMWTAPIWVEPLTGQTHSWYMRALSGNAEQLLYGSPYPRPF